MNESAAAELPRKLPGVLEHLETENPGMHTTDSIDYGIVLKGEICLELDNGQEKTLKARRLRDSKWRPPRLEKPVYRTGTDGFYPARRFKVGRFAATF